MSTLLQTPVCDMKLQYYLSLFAYTCNQIRQDLSYVKYVYVTPVQRSYDPIFANNRLPHFLFLIIGLYDPIIL